MHRSRLVAVTTIAWLAIAGCKCGLDESDEAAGGGTGEHAAGGEQGEQQGSEKSAGATGPAPPKRLPHPDLDPVIGQRPARPWGDLDANALADPIVGFVSAPPSPAHRSRVFPSTAEAIATDPVVALPGGDTGRPSELARRLGDLDGDGHADVAIGHGMRGQLRVYRGGDGGPSEQAAIELRDPEDAAGSSFGNAAAAGDVDGDGHRDLLVGAYTHGDDRGRVYVFGGTAGGLADEPKHVLDGPDGAGGRFGDELTACDVDGDGIDDVIVGAPRARDRRGRVHVHAGGAEGPSPQPTATLEVPDGPDDPERTHWGLGRLVTSAGDVDEPDGCTVVVAATGVSHSGAYLLRQGSADAEPSLEPLAAPDDPVQGIAAGDLTGDGAVDVVVSTHGSVRVHVADEGAVPATEPTAVLDPPEAASGYFGTDVAVIGDANGDGRSELLVGAPSWKGEAGSAWVFYGTVDGLRGEPARLWQIVREHEDFAVWVE